jgi:hypothetical protein
MFNPKNSGQLVLNRLINNRFSKPHYFFNREPYLNKIDAIFLLDSSSIYGSKYGYYSDRLCKRTRHIGSHKLSYRPYRKII